MALDGRHISTVLRAYRTFGTLIQTLSGGAAKGTFADNLDVSLDAGGGVVHVHTSRPLLFRAARERPHSGRTRLFDVYVRFKQTVEDDGDGRLQLRSSSVAVSYVMKPNADERAAGQRPWHRGVHFDFVDEDHHPVFHAQVDDDDPGDIEEDECDCWRRSDTPRIPVAPMDLCAVVYMILHDHYPSVVKRGWPDKARGAVAELPRIPLHLFAEIVGEQLDCVHWYPRHRP